MCIQQFLKKNSWKMFQRDMAESKECREIHEIVGSLRHTEQKKVLVNPYGIFLLTVGLFPPWSLQLS